MEESMTPTQIKAMMKDIMQEQQEILLQAPAATAEKLIDAKTENTEETTRKTNYVQLKARGNQKQLEF